jgi:hypothetical protein
MSILRCQSPKMRAILRRVVLCGLELKASTTMAEAMRRLAREGGQQWARRRGRITLWKVA